MIGLGLSSPEQHYFVPFALLKSKAAAPLLDWLGDEQASKSGYDLHRADLALHWQGIAFAGAANDVQLAAYLLDPTEASQNLNDLTTKYGLPRLSPDEDVFGKGAKYRIPELKILGEHVARKSATVLGIVQKQQEELDKTDMTGLFQDLEMPLSRILADMEKQGIAVNKDDLVQLGKEFEAQISRLVTEIYAACGTEFNLNSPKQLGEVLFVKLGLPVVKKTKTGYSTDAEVLEKLAPYHDAVRLILQYRTIAKLQSTYVEGLMKEISPETGKVHTFTGRRLRPRAG